MANPRAEHTRPLSSRLPKPKKKKQKHGKELHRSALSISLEIAEKRSKAIASDVRLNFLKTCASVLGYCKNYWTKLTGSLTPSKSQEKEKLLDELEKLQEDTQRVQETTQAVIREVRSKKRSVSWEGLLSSKQATEISDRLDTIVERHRDFDQRANAQDYWRNLEAQCEKLSDDAAELRTAGKLKKEASDIVLNENEPFIKTVLDVVNRDGLMAVRNLDRWTRAPTFEIIVGCNAEGEWDIVYIGQSINMGGRFSDGHKGLALLSHPSYSKGHVLLLGADVVFDSPAGENPTFVPIEEVETGTAKRLIDAVEGLLTIIHQPRFNKENTLEIKKKGAFKDIDNIKVKLDPVQIQVQNTITHQSTFLPEDKLQDATRDALHQMLYDILCIYPKP